MGLIALRLEKAFRGLGSSHGRRAALSGAFQAAELRKVLGHTRADNVIDIGANRGQFVLLVADLLPQAKVFAFEPQSRPHATLSAVADLVPNLVQCFPYALGTESRTAEIFVADEDDSSSLLKPTSRQVDLFPGSEVVGTEKIEIRRAGVVIPQEAFAGRTLVKIDVQGMELEVLKSFDPEQLGSIEQFLVELSLEELYTGQPLASEVISWLSVHGFNLVNVGGISAIGGANTQVDALFSRNEAGREAL